jgi:hypothetical protein
MYTPQRVSSLVKYYYRYLPFHNDEGEQYRLIMVVDTVVYRVLKAKKWKYHATLDEFHLERYMEISESICWALRKYFSLSELNQE